VGATLGNGFLTVLGYEVKMGSRDGAANPKSKAWVEKAASDKASAGTFAEAAAFGDIVVLATLGAAAEDAIKMAGVDNLRGKVVIDATNPLHFAPGAQPTLFVGTTDSLGERIQAAAPDAKVVKAYNSVGHGQMVKPSFKAGAPTMPIAGNDEGAKKTVSDILAAFGWGAVDVGGIDASRYLEPFAMVWILHGVRGGGWGHAFKLLHQGE
jgi:predicted dinucleotide-binding enzyme